MYIVRIHGSGGSIRYVLITGSPGGSSQAREQAEARLGPGEFAGIAVPASAQGISTMRAQAPDFVQQFGVDTPIDQIIQRLGGQGDIGGWVPPVGGEGEGVPGMENLIRGGAEAQFGPMFRAGLADRGITLGGGGGIEGRLAEQARDPFFSRSLASAAFADPSATTATALPSFQDMVRGGALFGGSAAQQARDLLTQAQGFGSDFTGRGELAGSILNPGTVQEGTNLANIAREAGRQRFGSFARFLPQAGSLSEGFFAQPATGAQTFADFLNQKIFGV